MGRQKQMDDGKKDCEEKNEERNAWKLGKKKMDL